MDEKKEKMKENMPEFFADKELLFSLIAWVKEYSYCRFRWEERDHIVQNGAGCTSV